MNLIRLIREWWNDLLFEYRVTHGLCTDCGQRRIRLGGTTMCRPCFERRYPYLARMRRQEGGQP